jgi:hypothetical protein
VSRSTVNRSRRDGFIVRRYARQSKRGRLARAAWRFLSTLFQRPPHDMPHYPGRASW